MTSTAFFLLLNADRLKRSITFLTQLPRKHTFEGLPLKSQRMIPKEKFNENFDRITSELVAPGTFCICKNLSRGFSKAAVLSVGDTSYNECHFHFNFPENFPHYSLLTAASMTPSRICFKTGFFLRQHPDVIPP